MLSSQSVAEREVHEELLALHGGPPVLEPKCFSRRRWDERELQQLREDLTQESLFYWNGEQTKLLTERFQEQYSGQIYGMITP